MLKSKVVTINKFQPCMARRKNMFDMEKIMNLTADEIIIVNGLNDVAKEAKAVSKLISCVYTFPMNKNKIKILEDLYNKEYITHDGVWQARYLNQSYDIKCTEDEIFNYFKAEYLVENGFVKKGSDNDDYKEEVEKANICKYFRAFLKRTKELSQQ